MATRTVSLLKLFMLNSVVKLKVNESQKLKHMCHILANGIKLSRSYVAVFLKSMFKPIAISYLSSMHSKGNIIIQEFSSFWKYD